MLFRQASPDYLLSLPPPPPEWPATGARPLTPDPRDYPITRHPHIAERLALGAPPSCDLSRYVVEIRNQGPIPACVAYSTCEVIDLDAKIGSGAWPPLVPLTLHYELGGTNTTAIDSRQCLERCRGAGAPAADGSRTRIGSYLWVPQMAGQFRESLKAAISENKPCCLATLLPSGFGWSSSGGPTRAYHQMAAIGYDETWLVLANSWGREFGNNGLVRLAWDYLEGNNFLGHYTFAFTVDPQGFPNPPPPPPPDGGAQGVLPLLNQERARVGAAALQWEARLAGAAQGFAAQMAAQNFFSHNGPDGSTPGSRIGAAIGTPAAWAENIAAGTTTPAQVMQQWMNSPPHRANMLNPAFTHVGVGFATNPAATYRSYWCMDLARLGGAPPPPPPPPPQELTVDGRVVASGQYLIAFVDDAAGQPQSTTVTATAVVGSPPVGRRVVIAAATLVDGKRVIPAIWFASNLHGLVTLTARGADGRTGTTSVTLP